MFNFFYQQIREPLINDFLKLGGTRCASPWEAGKGFSHLILI